MRTLSTRIRRNSPTSACRVARSGHGCVRWEHVLHGIRSSVFARATDPFESVKVWSSSPDRAASAKENLWHKRAAKRPHSTTRAIYAAGDVRISIRFHRGDPSHKGTNGDTKAGLGEFQSAFIAAIRLTMTNPQSYEDSIVQFQSAFIAAIRLTKRFVAVPRSRVSIRFHRGDPSHSGGN